MHRRPPHTPPPPPADWSAAWVAAICAAMVAGIVAVLAYLNRDAGAPPPAAPAAASQTVAPPPPPPAGLLSGDITSELRDQLFQALPDAYAEKTVYVHKDAYADLVRMMDTARRDGVHLQVVSGFRSYKHQKAIWERKWKQLSGSPRDKTVQVLDYSSFPGISRHHWGSDVDFNSVEPDYWLSEAGMKTHLWLRRHAPTFGFCEPYSGNRAGGYSNEAWHWSHKRSARTPAEAADAAFLSELLKRPVSGADTLTADDLRPLVTEIAAECAK